MLGASNRIESNGRASDATQLAAKSAFSTGECLGIIAVITVVIGTVYKPADSAAVRIERQFSMFY